MPHATDKGPQVALNQGPVWAGGGQESFSHLSSTSGRTDCKSRLSEDSKVKRLLLIKTAHSLSVPQASHRETDFLEACHHETWVGTAKCPKA